MRWRTGRRSDNVEDRRGQRFSRGPVAIGGGGAILLIVVAALFGADPIQILQLLSEGGTATNVGTGAQPIPSGDEPAEFVSSVLADTEDTWSALFAAAGTTYEPPGLVLYTGEIPSACGFGAAAMGPFYCPGDRKIYIDLSFYEELREQFGAPGDFAQAYVIAHEVGHHVQQLLGISDEIEGRRRALDEAGGNALSVRLELQADCLAGVWGHHAARERDLLEQGDVEEGLRAAAAIGDDRIQNRTTGRVYPESWTHGSSEQRVRWFRLGLESGSTAKCDTFAARAL